MSWEDKGRFAMVCSLFASGLLFTMGGCADPAGNNVDESRNEPKSDTPKIQAVLLGDGSVLIDGDRVSRDKIGAKLVERYIEFEKSAIDTDDVTIRVSANTGATYGTLERVCQETLESSFHKLELQTPTRKYVHTFYDGHSLPDSFVPPVRAHVEANEDGTLAKIVCDEAGDKRDFASIDEFRKYIREHLGDERGPGSIQSESKANFSADDNLLFSQFAKVLTAAAFDGDKEDDRPLIASVWPVPNRRPKSLIEAFERIEVDELKVEELESLDVERFDASGIMPPKLQIVDEATEEQIQVELVDQSGEIQKRFAHASAESLKVEDAVSRALEWLARHQMTDGGWDFDHRNAEPEGRRTDGQGDLPHARNGATALAMMAFLSTGQTHLEGRYKETLRRGIEYLLKNQEKSGDLASFADGGNMHSHGMYSHGLATIALCEAYAMTADKNLREPAQFAINHIIYAQDPVGGGWRYNPKQAGDMSVTGWQIYALKTGHMGYLTIPPTTISAAIKFLESVEKDRGAFYGYMAPGQGPATTAIGIKCRLHLGWEHDHPAVVRGVKWLCELGPALEDGKSDMYFNYFAAQVIARIGGEQWDKWRESLHDRLISKQSREGLSAGSWFLPGDQGSDRGGRLNCTALAVLSLRTQVIIPIVKIGEAEFPLE